MELKNKTVYNFIQDSEASCFLFTYILLIIWYSTYKYHAYSVCFKHTYFVVSFAPYNNNPMEKWDPNISGSIKTYDENLGFQVRTNVSMTLVYYSILNLGSKESLACDQKREVGT